MAVNTPTRVFSEGTASKIAVYRYVNLTAADTFQMSGDFVKVASATLMSAFGVTQNPTISALTTLTVAAGPSNEDGYLIVQGQST